MGSRCNKARERCTAPCILLTCCKSCSSHKSSSMRFSLNGTIEGVKPISFLAISGLSTLPSAQHHMQYYTHRKDIHRFPNAACLERQCSSSTLLQRKQRCGLGTPTLHTTSNVTVHASTNATLNARQCYPTQAAARTALRNCILPTHGPRSQTRITGSCANTLVTCVALTARQRARRVPK